MKKILFVCSGNTCRSPMAAGLFNMLAQKAGLTVRAGSAGLAVTENSPASRNAVVACREAGADITGHRARRLDQAAAAQSDEIYAMTPGLAQTVKDLFPAAREKIFLLGRGIPDPYGGDIGVYRRCRDEILKAVSGILENDQKEFGGANGNI